MRTKHINLAKRGFDYQIVVLWKRSAGATEIWQQLYDRHPGLREDLDAAIPRIDSGLDEVTAKIGAKYFDDPPVEIKKSITRKETPKMVTEEIPAHEAHDLAMRTLHAKAAELRKREPHLTEAQSFERAYRDKSNSDLVMAERHSNGVYKYRELESLKAITKAMKEPVRKERLPDVASLEPDDLGNFLIRRGARPGLRERRKERHAAPGTEREAVGERADASSGGAGL